jgi:mono/diheme cytochrome c family protein
VAQRLFLLSVSVISGLFLAVLSAASQTPAASQSPSPPTGNAEKGQQLFMKDGCYECHGTQGQGGPAGPRLGPNPIPLTSFTKYIRQPKLQMPPYTSKVLSDEDAADIHAFLRARPRPARIELLDVVK